MGADCQLGSTAHTLWECVKMVQEIGIDVKDGKELWLGLERQFERVKNVSKLSIRMIK